MSSPGRFLPTAGKTYQLGRITLNIKLGGADTRGAYTLTEAVEPPGAAAGLHRHPTYDETHIICAGRYECQLGDDTLTLGPGEMMFAPRGMPHGIRSLGPDVGRELIIATPGGIFESFIDEVVTSMVDGGGQKAGPAVDFRAIAAKYGIEFLS